MLEVFGDLFTAFHELDRIRLAAKANRVFGEFIDFAPMGAIVGDDRHETTLRSGNKAICDFRTARKLLGYRLCSEA